MKKRLKIYIGAAGAILLAAHLYASDLHVQTQTLEIIVSRLILYSGFFVIPCLGYVNSIKTRRVLNGMLLAWGLWLSLLFIRWTDWSWDSFLEAIQFVLPAAAAWNFVIRAREQNRVSRAVWLLCPCSIPISTDIIYSALSAGYLVKRYGCGCKFEGINTNDITVLFFSCVWIVSLIFTGFVSRRESLRYRLIHLALVGGYTSWLGYKVMTYNIWL